MSLFRLLLSEGSIRSAVCASEGDGIFSFFERYSIKEVDDSDHFEEWGRFPESFEEFLDRRITLLPGECDVVGNCRKEGERVEGVFLWWE